MTQMQTDILGRPYAKLSELRVGDKVVVDDGFDYMAPWSELQVFEDERGELAIVCNEGQHTLDGQIMDDGDSLMGVYRKEGFVP